MSIVFWASIPRRFDISDPDSYSQKPVKVFPVVIECHVGALTLGRSCGKSKVQYMKLKLTIARSSELRMHWPTNFWNVQDGGPITYKGPKSTHLFISSRPRIPKSIDSLESSPQFTSPSTTHRTTFLPLCTSPQSSSPPLVQLSLSPTQSPKVS